MCKYMVTEEEYNELLGGYKDRKDKIPVRYLSWFEAAEYCNWRSDREGLVPAYTIIKDDITWNRKANGYRLPTEDKR